MEEMLYSPSTLSTSDVEKKEFEKVLGRYENFLQKLYVSCHSSGLNC